MNRSNKQERGQALILIVFAIVGLIGLTGLAIDGGNAYSDRRHAQNAADTSAMAAALSKTRGRDWVAAGEAIAKENGFDPTANPQVTVDIYDCAEPTHTPQCVLGADEVPSNYVQVVISSVTHTYFAPVVGIRQISNQVQAIAQAIPGAPKPWYDGNAIVALMPGCKTPGWNSDPFTFAGNNVTLVQGTGIFVNSTCDPAFLDSGNSNSMQVPAGVCVVGGVPSSVNGVNPPPTPNCGTPVDTSQYQLPPLTGDSCENEGRLIGGVWDGQGFVVDRGGGVADVYPGNFSGQFPPGSYNRWNLKQGIYCLHGGMKMTGGTLTSDANGNGIYDVSTEGVLFYVEGGDVDMSGGANVNVHAITTSISPLGPDLVGYLMYLPAENGSSITLVGGASSKYVGTILAPGSLVTLSGGNSGDSLNLDAQIIGYSLKLAGDGNLNITYTQSSNATTWENPSISQYK